jgi:D-alanyl-D-alanine carboxypeptidase
MMARMVTRAPICFDLRVLSRDVRSSRRPHAENAGCHKLAETAEDLTRNLGGQPGTAAYGRGHESRETIIERVTGESYYDHIQKAVYQPAGMTGTGCQPESEGLPNLAVGYTKIGPNGPDPSAPWRPNTETLPYRGTSAGGGYSTVGDLVRFATALLEHKLLNAEHTTLLLAGKVEMPMPGRKYAYGFIENTSGAVRTVGHGGGAPGQNGDLIIHPDTGDVIAVLSNLDPPAASRLSTYASARLPVR